MSRQPLLLISRKDLVLACDEPGGEQMIRLLAGLTRRGFSFVATASQPSEWSRSKAESKRGRPGPRRLRDRLAEAGGLLDGVYYIPQSLMTQRTRNEEALRELLDRFGTEAKDCYLVSTDRALLATARKMQVNAIKISEKSDLVVILGDLMQTLDQENQT